MAGRISGKVVRNKKTGCYHIKWVYSDGTTRITSYGYKERKTAETTIPFILRHTKEV